MVNDPASAAPPERGHHPDSPSSLQSSESCALFLNEQRDSAASIAGTLQHKAAETRDFSILESDEQVAAVKAYLDYVDSTNAQAFAGLDDVFVLKEIFVSVGSEKTGEYIGITGGYPDEAYVAETFAYIYDAKFGRVPIEKTKENLQGIAYALGLFEKFPKLQRVTVCFFAPYQGWSDAEQKERYEHTFLRTDVTALELRIRTVIARKKSAVKQLENTGSWQSATPKNDLCIWCARKGDCKKLHALVIRGSEKHSDFIVPQELNPVALTKPELVKQSFKWANQVETIAKAVKDRCNKIAKEDDMDLGPELKLSKRTERQTKNIVELIAGAKRNGLSIREDVLPLLSIPFTKLEEAVKKMAAKGKGAEAIRRLNADWEEHGATQMGTPNYFLTEARSPKEKAQNVIDV